MPFIVLNLIILQTPYRAEIKEILEGPSASGDLALLAGEGFSGTQGAALVNGVVSKVHTRLSSQGLI